MLRIDAGVAPALRLTLLSCLFGFSAIAKLFPGEHVGLLQVHSVAGFLVSALELVLVGALLWSRSRRPAALAATLVLLAGGIYAAIRPRFALPACGCFGGVVELNPGWHVLVVGVAIWLLADFLHDVPEEVVDGK